MEFPETMLNQLQETGVVAGFAVDKVEHAVPLANALLAGGISVIELTLRTPAGMDALQAICENVPEILAGVGTILTPEQVRQVKEVGADFGVAPGLNPRVVQAAHDVGLPYAPGIATPSDLECAIELGCRFVKLFPAVALGGIPYLRSMSAPYKHLGIRYFPLGGINSDNMTDYLKEDNVLALGGTWIVKKELVLNEDWAAITARAAKVRNVVDAAREH
jgi:2-dehydro-3-deoxyphosphogluconate aldolase/(4S)-4-hydroxy-2-oxoglutarate aldolase